MYDRESAALERLHDQPDHREVDEMTVETLASVVAQPGPMADLGCGPGPHTLGLARRGYDVVGIDGSSRMIKVARERAAHDGVDATFRVADLSQPLCFADASLGASSRSSSCNICQTRRASSPRFGDASAPMAIC